MQRPLKLFAKSVLVSDLRTFLRSIFDNYPTSHCRAILGYLSTTAPFIHAVAQTSPTPSSPARSLTLRDQWRISNRDQRGRSRT